MGSRDELTTLHEQLGQVVVVGRDLSDVLAEITAIARRAMPRTDGVSITLIRDEEVFTAAYDGQLALAADELQYEDGDGPCLQAHRVGEVLVVDDMRTEQRWPDYARHAAERGVGSSLSAPLPYQHATTGALNSYARQPGTFTEEDVDLAEEVAGWVALAISNAQAQGWSSEERVQMRRAMASRALIEQAKGVLMERHRVTAEEAFTLLLQEAQRGQRKLRDMADEVVRTAVVDPR